MKYEGSVESLKQDNVLIGTGTYTYIGSFLDPTPGSRTKFIFHCSICAKDKELFGNSLFWTQKSDFHRGQIFCGCSNSVKWTQDQATVKSERAAREAGHIFQGIIQPFAGGISRCNLYCPKCEHSWTSKLSNLWTLKRGCPKCRSIKGLAAATASNKKSDDVVIKAFMATGRYHKYTTFVKIERKAKNSKNNYWRLYCPVCDKIAECQQGHLLSGTTPCDCSVLNKKESYINLLKDGEDIVAIKFGISKNSTKRLANYRYNTTYAVEMFCVFRYEDSTACLAAEQDCKNNLVCGVVSREVFKDGWTETTYPYNLDKVIYTFEKYGGVRVV